jgi:cytochrome c
VYTAVQADRGAAIYTQQCASCHLDDLSGHEMAPGLAGVAFSFRWRGSTLQDLFDSLRLTMPQASPGSLPREDYLDLIAFLLEANDYPDGASELVEDGLPRIAIERKPK